MSAKKYPTCKINDPKQVVAWARQFKKDHPEYPLTVLNSGYWIKRDRSTGGKPRVFGRLADPNAALAAYREFVRGDDPRASGLTVRDGALEFLDAMQHRCELGELSYASWRDYRAVCRKLVDVWGEGKRISTLTARDFVLLHREFAKTRTGKGLAHYVSYTKTIFTWLYENRRITNEPHYGTEFRRPSNRTMRTIREAKPDKLFSREQLQHLLNDETLVGYFRQPNVHAWRAMQWLAINCAFTGVDCADITFSTLDLDNGVHTFRRPKTMMPRRGILWPETIAAVQAYLPHRPKPQRGCDGFVFLNAAGGQWVKPARVDRGRIDKISSQYTGYLKAQGMYTPGNSFGTHRHVFATIGRLAKEPDALEYILGHVPIGMTAEYYVHRVGDDELQAVATHVHQWLFS